MFNPIGDGTSTEAHYNAQGLAYLYTSYADTAGTQIVNQVENIYPGAAAHTRRTGGTGFRGVEEVFWAAARHGSMLGQLAFQYQAVTGAVDISTTPVVEYTYSSPSNGSRLTSMVYPNGRTINYDYGSDLSNTNAALDNAIGRLDAIVDGANSGDAGTVLEQYSYLGLNTIVQRNHPQTGINLTYLGSSGSIGAGGDQYVGLDQFGRVVNQNWVNSSGATVDGYTYSYDANGNVTAKNNTLDSAYSQTYTYDQLNRLASSTLGGAAYQSWTLDSQGNWNSYTSNGTAQTETANAQNQITSINGTSAAPTYDANGNMTTAEYGENTLVYDAWNRLVSVTSVAFGGQAIAKYTYNALGYRITATYPAGTGGAEIEQQYYLYYDAMGQMIETRAGGTANNNVGSQMVWSAAYVNAAVLQDAYVNGVLQPDSRTYFQQDANWNMTAFVGLSGGAWQVMDRVVYSPYGGFVVYNSTWSGALSNSLPPTMDVSLYQGMAIDPMTGLYYARNRNYDPTLGRWINQDPAGFINGGNTYQFVMSNPVGNVDPWGLAVGHHIVPKQIYKLLFDPNSPGYGFFENFYTGKTSPNHGNSAAHQRYTDAVRKLVKKWLKGHPDVNPECPDFSEDNAKAIADDVLKSDDPGIRDFLQNVLNKVVDPSKYFQQMANTFEDAGGNLIATAKPESAPVENILQNIATNASNNAPRDETLAQQAESLLQEAENIIEADATALEQGIEEAP